ncbi:hypothetical protein ENSA7_13590 [Enhygromyxa salina]|uniref:Uncharacterized protein n=1 Tax=Enhygromyxa salina TaxID=215803 RepID=A0A2S9YV50_9BACT|nr:hypothetical protein ENSA7_13590 [Enhygromyxa salina]
MCCTIDDDGAACSVPDTQGRCATGKRLFCEYGTRTAGGGVICDQPFPSMCDAGFCIDAIRVGAPKGVILRITALGFLFLSKQGADARRPTCRLPCSEPPVDVILALQHSCSLQECASYLVCINRPRLIPDFTNIELLLPRRARLSNIA